MYILIVLEIRIPRASKGLTGERIYDKIHYSILQFAGKKIGRHLETRHKDELDIKMLQGLAKKEKLRQLDWLRILGDFYRNMVVLRTGGDLIVWWRPDKDAIVNVNDYIPCKFCLAFLLKSDLWKHVQGCPFKEEIIDEKNLVPQAQL